MQDGAPPQQPRRLTLILGALGEKVNRLLAGHFQADRFKGGVHESKGRSAKC